MTPLMTRDKDDWLYTDEHGNVWRLRSNSGYWSVPFEIILERRI